MGGCGEQVNDGALNDVFGPQVCFSSFLCFMYLLTQSFLFFRCGLHATVPIH
jgi:hypothetical protein